MKEQQKASVEKTTEEVSNSWRKVHRCLTYTVYQERLKKILSSCQIQIYLRSEIFVYFISINFDLNLFNRISEYIYSLLQNISKMNKNMLWLILLVSENWEALIRPNVTMIFMYKISIGRAIFVKTPSY